MDLKNFDTIFTNEKLNQSSESFNSSNSKNETYYKDFSFINGSLINKKEELK